MKRRVSTANQWLDMNTVNEMPTNCKLCYLLFQTVLYCNHSLDSWGDHHQCRLHIRWEQSLARMSCQGYELLWFEYKRNDTFWNEQENKRSTDPGSEKENSARSPISEHTAFWVSGAEGIMLRIEMYTYDVASWSVVRLKLSWRARFVFCSNSHAWWQSEARFFDISHRRTLWIAL